MCKREMSKNKFICIVGIDGSGKTTLAKSFVKEVKAKGYSYNYAWVNNQPIFMYILRFFWLIFLKVKKINDYDSYKSEKTNIATKTGIGSIYRIIHKIDYKIWVWYKVKLPLLFNKHIIVDRYFFDVAINYSLLNNFNEQELLNLIKYYQKWMPTPDLIFLISVPVEIAFARKNDIPSIKYLHERIDIYQQLKKPFDMIELDGRNDPNTIVSEMIYHLKV